MKCKLKCYVKKKCYVKPMKDPLGVSPSKGNQGATPGKEKILLTSVGIEPTTSGLDLPLLCRPEVVASIPIEVKRIFFFTSSGSLIPFTRANAQWVFHGLHIALKFTLQS